MDFVSQKASQLLEPYSNEESYCCLSLLSQTTPRQKYYRRMINIRSGSFKKRSQGYTYAKYLQQKYQKSDRDFDIFTTPIGQWIPWEDPGEATVTLLWALENTVKEIENERQQFDSRKDELINNGSEVIESATGNQINRTNSSDTDTTSPEVIENLDSIFTDPIHMLQNDQVDETIYYLISFMSYPDKNFYAFKIYSISDDLEKLEKEVETIKCDSYFKIYIGQIGKWLPWEASSSECQDEHWCNNKVDSFMTGYFDAQKTIKKKNQRD